MIIRSVLLCLFAPSSQYSGAFQAGMDDMRSLLQPSSLCRVNSEFKPGCSGLFLFRFWKSCRVEVYNLFQCLIFLTIFFFFFFLLIASQPPDFSLWSLPLSIYLSKVPGSIISIAFPLVLGDCCEVPQSCLVSGMNEHRSCSFFSKSFEV